MERIDINKINHYNNILKILYKYNHYPIGITTMMCEDTFIFDSKEEASKGFKEMESNERIAKGVNCVQGWWYGKSEWPKVREEYIEKAYDREEDDAPSVHWIEKGKFIEIPEINYKDNSEKPSQHIKNDIIVVGLFHHNKEGYTDPTYHKEGYYNTITDEWYLFTGSKYMETYEKIDKDDILSWYYIEELYK